MIGRLGFVENATLLTKDVLIVVNGRHQKVSKEQLMDTCTAKNVTKMIAGIAVSVEKDTQAGTVNIVFITEATRTNFVVVVTRREHQSVGDVIIFSTQER